MRDLAFSVILLFLNFGIKSPIILRLSYLVFIALRWDVKIGKSQSWLCDNLNGEYQIVKKT